MEYAQPRTAARCAAALGEPVRADVGRRAAGHPRCSGGSAESAAERTARGRRERRSNMRRFERTILLGAMLATGAMIASPAILRAGDTKADAKGDSTAADCKDCAIDA